MNAALGVLPLLLTQTAAKSTHGASTQTLCFLSNMQSCSVRAVCLLRPSTVFSDTIKYATW